MLTTRMVTLITGHLGNRASGKIGSLDVAVVVLEGINKGIRKICSTATPKLMEYLVEVDVPDEEHAALNKNLHIVAIPQEDVDSKGIDIIEIISHVFTRADEYIPISLKYVTSPRFDLLHTPVDVDNIVATPTEFAWYGDNLYFGPSPIDTYTLYLNVKAFPVVLEGGPDEVIPFHDMWIDTLEAYATYYCFHALQQVQTASSWLTAYGDLKGEVMHLIEKRPDLDRNIGGRGAGGARYHLDPYARRP